MITYVGFEQLFTPVVHNWYCEVQYWTQGSLSEESYFLYHPLQDQDRPRTTTCQVPRFSLLKNWEVAATLPDCTRTCDFRTNSYNFSKASKNLLSVLLNWWEVAQSAFNQLKTWALWISLSPDTLVSTFCSNAVPLAVSLQRSQFSFIPQGCHH